LRKGDSGVWGEVATAVANLSFLGKRENIAGTGDQVAKKRRRLKPRREIEQDGGREKVTEKKTRTGL